MNWSCACLHRWVALPSPPVQSVTDKPSLIKVSTLIGYGSPNKADTHDVHGAPLGASETAATREQLNWPYGEFEVRRRTAAPHTPWNAVMFNGRAWARWAAVNLLWSIQTVLLLNLLHRQQANRQLCCIGIAGVPARAVCIQPIHSGSSFRPFANPRTPPAAPAPFPCCRCPRRLTPSSPRAPSAVPRPASSGRR